MRLRRISIDVPGVRRRRRGRGFSYIGTTGGPVRDRATLERIRALAIPPAWEDVWISPDPAGHIQAVGSDAAGRRQYLYHERWRARRDAEKFDRMLDFARALPRLRTRVESDLRRRGLPKERVLAAAVRLLDRGLFRIGSEAYTRRNGSYGLATLRREHVTIRGRTMAFAFAGKSGVRQERELVDPGALSVIRSLKDRTTRGGELLVYRDGRAWADIRSEDINEYVREASEGDFTAKDFRTWHATVLAAVVLARESGDLTGVTSRRRVVSGAVKEVAAVLGNTPAVARSSYIDPRVVDRFEEGATIEDALRRIRGDDPTDPSVRGAIESAVLELLDEGSSARAA
jgi:DNA topoisomerase IB